MRRRHKWDPVCGPPRGLVAPVPIDPSGTSGPTRGQARGRKWRESTHMLYVPSFVDATVPEQRIIEKSMLLGSDGAVTGWAACRQHGANFFDGRQGDRDSRPALRGGDSPSSTATWSHVPARPPRSNR